MPAFARRLLWWLVLAAGGFCLGAAALYSLERRGRPAPPDGPTIVTRMREVAKLEALEVTLYKKVAFEPGPEPTDSVWGDLFNFVRFSLHAPKGRAIVFAKLHLGLDLAKLDVDRLRVRGDSVEVVLPPTEVKVELLPGETEVIASNLDSAETAKLLELAKDAFEREARADRRLQEKARLSAERAIRALLITLGFRQVSFVERLSSDGAS